MKVEDSVRRALRHRAEAMAVPPADLGGRARVPEMSHRPPRGSKAVAIVVGMAMFFVPTGIAWFVFRPAGTVGSAAAPNGLLVYSDIRTEGVGEDHRVIDDWHLYILDPATGDPTRIGPEGLDEAIYPSWSPDGSEIAFVGFTGENEPGPPRSRIYLIDASGGNLREIYAPPDGAQVGSLAWSSDGTSIGFELQDLGGDGAWGGPVEDESFTIWRMAPDGSDPRQLTHAGREMHFGWSPDGRSIVFERFEPVASSTEIASSAFDLFVLDVATGEERRLTDDGMSRDPSWSPDGTSIAFARGAAGERHVGVVSTDGTELADFPQAATSTIEGLPYGNSVLWSPDATSIAFSRRGDADVCSISLLTIATGDIRRFVSSPGREACPGQEGMSWAKQTSAVATIASDVLRVDCTSGEAVFESTTVQVQSDGVHVSVDLGRGTVGFIATSSDVPPVGDGGLAVDSDGQDHLETILPLAPGAYFANCWHEETYLALDASNGYPIQVIDPQGIWHPSDMRCEGEVREGFFDGGDPTVNPPSMLEEVVRRSVPGLAPADELTYAGYPDNPSDWTHTIRRGGEVVARLRLHTTDLDRSIDVAACADSGIGADDGQTSGPLATVFEIPPFERCDPYAEQCATVWVSEARYAELRGETVPEAGDLPACPETGPNGCEVRPDDRPLEVLMVPEDAEAFVARYGCGSSEVSMCRLDG